MFQIFIIQYEITFFTGIHVKVFYIQIRFKCETQLLFFQKIMVNRKSLYRKILFFGRLCKNYWTTCCAHVTPHVIWVDEITGVIIYIYIYITVKVIKLVIMHICQLLCIISSPIETSDEKRKFYQIFRLFSIIFRLNGEFEYQMDYLQQPVNINTIASKYV